MKKLLAIFLFFLLATKLFVPNDVSAQLNPNCDPENDNGCFFCNWFYPTQDCFPDKGCTGGGTVCYQCLPNNEPDEDICDTFDGDEDPCIQATGFECVSSGGSPPTDCEFPNACMDPNNCPDGNELPGLNCLSGSCCAPCALCDTINSLCNYTRCDGPHQYDSIDECRAPAAGCEPPSPEYVCTNNNCEEVADGDFDTLGQCILSGCETSVPIATPPMKCDPAGQPSGTGIDTAIGCIPFADNNAFVEFVLGWSIGIGGGISFILSVIAGFMITTSAGDPKKLVAGKELLMAALSGLMLLIFSVFILRFFGYEILGLPGF